MTSPLTGAANPPSNHTSPSSSPPTPLLLLKTRNTPTDAYATYFSTPSAPTPSPSPRLHPTFIPVLHHTLLAPSLSHLHTLLSLPPSTFPYGGLICTSQRAVEALGQVLSTLSTNTNGNSTPTNEAATQAEVPNPTTPLQTTPSTLQLPLYTVGPATAHALAALQQRHLPRCSVHGRETGNGAKLAAFILAHYAPPPGAAPTSTDYTPPPVLALSTSSSALPLTTNGVGTEAARAPLLFLVGEQRRDVIPRTLAARGLEAGRRVRVDELVVYTTGVVEGFGGVLEEWLGDLGGGLVDGKELVEDGRTIGKGGGGGRRGPIWVAVFSPTGCAEMVRVLRGRGSNDDGRGGGSVNTEAQREIFVASIGPTTRDYLLEEFDFRVDVCAESPSPEGLAEGIAQFMRERGM
ncbi:hypothetical protein MMC17_008808 [Xylographa soralifera]|nr:hypothetical protein [Xylographa soralifera]